jgi:hypothetical protein
MKKLVVFFLAGNGFRRSLGHGLSQKFKIVVDKTIKVVDIIPDRLAVQVTKILFVGHPRSEV